MYCRSLSSLQRQQCQRSIRKASRVVLCPCSVSKSHVKSTGCLLALKHTFEIAKREGSVLGRHQELLSSWLDLLLTPKRHSPFLPSAFVMVLAIPRKGSQLH